MKKFRLDYARIRNDGVEASQQLRKFGSERPSHVFVQAGVGSLAGAVIGYFANAFPENPPIMVVVEAQAADCLYQSAIKKTEKFAVDGDLQTIMAGLACGEPNTISFDILKIIHPSLFQRQIGFLKRECVCWARH